jgi:UDP-N-acetylglucosamine 2-epimerase
MNLEVGSGSHAVQTAEIMKRFEPVLLQERPDAVVVVGDVNSTIACSLVAAKATYPADTSGNSLGRDSRRDHGTRRPLCNPQEEHRTAHYHYTRHQSSGGDEYRIYCSGGKGCAEEDVRAVTHSTLMGWQGPSAHRLNSDQAAPSSSQEPSGAVLIPREVAV